ncbi:IS982 family transposase [Acinetobacter beijerinckii]
MVRKSAFPNLPSYNRMIELMPRCLQALSSFFHTVKGQCTDISLIDSTKIKVCDNRRIHRHKVFKGLAERGKTSMDWFYGFKLHLIINNLGEIVSLKIKAGNVHDVRVVNELSRDIIGLLLGDKGYVSKKLETEPAQSHGRFRCFA